MHHISLSAPQITETYYLRYGNHEGFSRTHQPTDLLLPVGRRASCGFNHSGGLIICQLFNAPLTRYNVAHLEIANT